MRKKFYILITVLGLVFSMNSTVFAFEAYDADGHETQEYLDKIKEAEEKTYKTGELWIVDSETGEIVKGNSDYTYTALDDIEYKVKKGNLKENANGDIFSCYYTIKIKLPKITNQYGKESDDSILQMYIPDGTINNETYYMTSGNNISERVLCYFKNSSDNKIIVETVNGLVYEIPIDTSWWKEDDLDESPDYASYVSDDVNLDAKLNLKISKVPKSGQVKPFNLSIESNLDGTLYFDDMDKGTGRTFTLSISKNGDYNYSFYANNGKTKQGVVSVYCFKDTDVYDANASVDANTDNVWKLDENGHDISKYVSIDGNPSSVPVGNGSNDDLLNDTSGMNESMDSLVQTGIYIESGVFICIGLVIVFMVILVFKRRFNNAKK